MTPVHIIQVVSELNPFEALVNEQTVFRYRKKNISLFI